MAGQALFTRSRILNRSQCSRVHPRSRVFITFHHRLRFAGEWEARLRKMFIIKGVELTAGKSNEYARDEANRA